MKKTYMAMSELQRIPSVDKSTAEKLIACGVYTLDDLKGANADDLFAKVQKKLGQKVNKCVLYTIRCAVYYASTDNPDPEKLKWWNWKD